VKRSKKADETLSLQKHSHQRSRERKNATLTARFAGNGKDWLYR
jgi:hypothetical protein